MTDDMKDNNNSEAGLRAQLEKVTEERDWYELRLKALVLVLADIGADNDGLKKDNDGMKKEIAVSTEGLNLFLRYMKSDPGSQRSEAKKEYFAWVAKHEDEA
jgi:hypothetical protein